MKRLFGRIMLSLALLLPFAPALAGRAPAGAPADAVQAPRQSSQFAAIALDRSRNYAYGVSWDQPTRADAERVALEEVAKRGGHGSVVLAWSGGGCGSYRTIAAASGSAYGWGSAPTQGEADAIATSEAAKRANGVPANNHAWACNSNRALPFTPIFTAANSQAASVLSGLWSGSYSYATSGRPPVPFSLQLTASGSTVTGTVTEPNTFGDSSTSVLRAKISGTIEGRSVTFLKTYDGTGGQNHGVRYKGELDPATRTIRGEWTLADVRGTFQLQFKQP